MNNEVMLSNAAAAAALGISPDTLKSWRSQGRSPEFVKLSRRAVRYRASAIEAFLANATVPPAQADKRAA